MIFTETKERGEMLMTIINGKAETTHEYMRRENRAAGRGNLLEREGARPASLSHGVPTWKTWLSPRARRGPVFGFRDCGAEGPAGLGGRTGNREPQAQARVLSLGAAAARAGSVLAGAALCTEVFSSLSSPDPLRPDHPGAGQAAMSPHCRVSEGADRAR